MEFIDKLLKCADCGNSFVFTAGEQMFFHDKNFHNDPKRCKTCKLKRVASAPDGLASRSPARTETRITCSACGAPTTVPFRPTQGRPVLCRSCFVQKRPPAPVPI
jgi:CxxC-x17-CxxC domain-containing protein